MGEDLALVETTDIITPLVDDPFTFGRIAAANALSDVYAMGGRPVTAMNLAFFPACSLPVEILARYPGRRPGQVATAAGLHLVGGHTVEDDELKYGLAVTGLIHPERIVRNSTAGPGDRLRPHQAARHRRSSPPPSRPDMAPTRGQWRRRSAG